MIPTNVYRGSESRVRGVLRALMARGHRVSLAVLNSSVPRTPAQSIASEIARDFATLESVQVMNHPKLAREPRGWLELGGIRLHDAWSGASHRVHGRFTCPPRFRSLVANMCAEIEPDFLLVNYAKLASVVPPDFRGVTVLDTHDFQTAFLRQDQIHNRQQLHVDLELFQRSEEEAVRRFDRVVAINPSEKVLFERMCPGREIHLVPAFTETCPSPREDPALPLYDALFVGSQLSFNVSALAWFVDEVLPAILERSPEFRLGVVGTVARADAMKARQRPGIDFLGIVDDVEPYYAASTCVIAPLLGGAGMKIKVVEALGFGKAVVATPHALDGIRAENGENALIAHDASAFAASVLRVLTQPLLRRRLESGAQALHGRDHSLEAVARALDQVFGAAPPYLDPNR